MRSEVEVELIRKCRTGDARFFEPLVRAYEGPGLRVATGMLGDVDDARDALQEAFVKVFRNLSKFDTRRAFGPWFFQILRNQCRDMLRSRNSRATREARDERLGIPEGTVASRLYHARRALRDALEELGIRYP